MLVVSMKQKYFVHYHIVGYIRVKKQPTKQTKLNNQVPLSKQEYFLSKYVERLLGHLNFIAMASYGFGFLFWFFLNLNSHMDNFWTRTILLENFFRVG